MFLPENAAQANNAEKQRKAAFKKIEEWSLQLIPEPLRNDVTISVQEIQCGDPQCSPIDTAIAVVFDRYVVEFYVDSVRGIAVDVCLIITRHYSSLNTFLSANCICNKNNCTMQWGSRHVWCTG